jgi:hypothetical protein
MGQKGMAVVTLQGTEANRASGVWWCVAITYVFCAILCYLDGLAQTDRACMLKIVKWRQGYKLDYERSTELKQGMILISDEST